MPIFSCQGRQNSAFGKQSFCLGDTRHVRRFPGFEEQKCLVFVGRMHYQKFRRFRQNHLFSGFLGKIDRKFRWNREAVKLTTKPRVLEGGRAESLKLEWPWPFWVKSLLLHCQAVCAAQHACLQFSGLSLVALSGCLCCTTRLLAIFWSVGFDPVTLCCTRAGNGTLGRRSSAHDNHSRCSNVDPNGSFGARQPL